MNFVIVNQNGEIVESGFKDEKSASARLMKLRLITNRAKRWRVAYSWAK